MLSRAGYVVNAATDANDAMRACTTQQFDVLSDVMMPTGSGYELARNGLRSIILRRRSC
jgi:CheY-like chemotaxis protein